MKPRIKIESKPMSVETAGGIATLKWLWSAVFVPFVWWLFNKVDKLEEKSYSKAETDQQIDLKINPLQRSVDDNTSATKELSALVTDLRVLIARVTAEQQGRRYD